MDGSLISGLLAGILTILIFIFAKLCNMGDMISSIIDHLYEDEEIDEEDDTPLH